MTSTRRNVLTSASLSVVCASLGISGTARAEQSAGKNTTETTIAELYPHYEPRYIPEILLNYAPGTAVTDNERYSEKHPSDTVKAQRYEVDIKAIRENITDGSLQLGSLGTEALEHVQQLESAGIPRGKICQLLPRRCCSDRRRSRRRFRGTDARMPGRELADPTLRRTSQHNSSRTRSRSTHR